MARFEADFDPGEDDRMPEWVVVEWTSDNGKGTRIGRTVERFYGADAEVSAHQLAETMNIEWAIALENACEFDSNYEEFPAGEFPRQFKPNYYKNFG